MFVDFLQIPNIISLILCLMNEPPTAKVVFYRPAETTARKLVGISEPWVFSLAFLTSQI